jgi:molybdate/tungstate transport system permease protein
VRIVFYFIVIMMGGVMVFFLILPVLKLILGTHPSEVIRTITEEEVLRSIILTVRCGLGATAFAVVFGTPLAYLLARFDFRGKSFLQSFIDLPLVIPHSSAGVALLLIFGRRFLTGKIFDKIGISFVGTEWGIMVAMAFVSAPFYINAVKDGISSVDVRLEKVARTLGASPLKAFFKITLPLSWRSIITGGVTMWARSISEFGAVVILAYHPMTAPVLIFDRFESFGLSYAKPAAALVLIISLVIFLLIRGIFKNAGAERR